MNQIAAAHEKDLIKQGCTLKITADYKNTNNVDSDESLHGPSIKIQLVEKGQSKDLNIGEFYQPDLPVFF